MSLYNFKAARTDEQLAQMQELDAEGVCIFCPENIESDNEKLLFQTERWMVKNNSYPYEGAKLHLLLIPKSHAATISGLSKHDRAELMETIVECEKRFKLESYAVGIRSGDMTRNGGSIEHLHVHLVVGDTEAEGHQPVRFKMSSKP